MIAIDRSWRILFTLLLFCSASTSHVQSQQVTHMPASIMAQVRKPETFPALLQNLKLAIDHGLLIDDAFYASGTLERFLGGSEIAWQPVQGTTLKAGSLYGFGRIVEPLSVGVSRVDGLSIVFRLTETGQQRRANVEVGVTDSQAADFDLVQSMFGTDWILLPARALNHPDTRSVTHPHGNDAISYLGGNQSASWQLTFEFTPSGAVRWGYISMEGAKRHD
jgi:hypothetical protein